VGGEVEDGDDEHICEEIRLQTAVPLHGDMRKGHRFRAWPFQSAKDDHYGDNTPCKLFKEVMALTKMNYNNADIADGEPITIKFAREVGEILSYIPENEAPHPSYRFYI
jgi:hypothetical protein